MTRDEAVALLSLPKQEESDHSAIRRKYCELYSDFQLRLTNAPTPVLKSRFEGKLQELGQAVQILVPGMDVASIDLPTAEPQAETTAASSFATRGQSVTAPSAEAKAKPLEAGGPKYGVFALIVLLASAIAAIAHLAIALSGERQKQAAPELETMARLWPRLQNGSLALCNESRDSIVVKSAAVTFLTGGNLGSFNSSAHGWPQWEIKPGQRRNLDLVKGVEVIWDGSVAFYALNVEYSGSEWLLSGMWNEVKGDCLKLALDGSNGNIR